MDSAEAKQMAEDVQDRLSIDVEEMQEDEIHEEEQMAVDIDGILKEELDHNVEQLLAEVHAANAQAQQEPSTEDEELEEEELDEEEQQLEKIDEEERQLEEINEE